MSLSLALSRLPRLSSLYFRQTSFRSLFPRLSPTQFFSTKTSKTNKVQNNKIDKQKTYPWEGPQSEWELIVGLEIHAQIVSNSKLFSGASTQFGALPNTNVDLFDASIPGTLPRINEECIRQVIRTGLAIGGTVNPLSFFERKHYFYCDMPLGFQITQQTAPLVLNGQVVLDNVLVGGLNRAVRIARIQLEMDSGKNIHDVHPSTTLVDLNRAGVALMEIVSEPDMRSPEEAVTYVKKLISLLRHLNVCNADMSKSQMRFDVNVSINRRGEGFGERVEIKNLNSLRALHASIIHEGERQLACVLSGMPVERETRGWDGVANRTVRLRSKEQLLDYRFSPEPDLPPLMLPASLVEQLRAEMPLLPEEIAEKLTKECGLTPEEVGVIVADPACYEFFQTMLQAPPTSPLSSTRSAKKCASWLTSELAGRLRKSTTTSLDDSDPDSSHISWKDSPVTPLQLVSIIDLLDADVISGKIGKSVLELMAKGDSRLASPIVEEKDWAQIRDPIVIRQAVEKVIARCQKQMQTYLSNPEKEYRLLDFLVGQAIGELKGKASPVLTAQIFQQVIAERNK